LAALRFGTSSWKYDSWEGIIYEPGSPRSYLEQYAAHYDTVEIDQWFWSLFEAPEPRLPDPATAAEYARAVPDDFRFTIKIPNSITLTHHYQRDKSRPLRPNPHFLSPALFSEFLRTIQALEGRIGALILQFEYLNRQKMASLSTFLQRLEQFLGEVPRPAPFALECRNPNYLGAPLFRFLRRHDLAPCFLQGYYMPDVRSVARRWEAGLEEDAEGGTDGGRPGAAEGGGGDIGDAATRIAGVERAGEGGRMAILRLHGPDREGMDRTSGKRWDRLLAPKDEEIEGIADLISRFLGRKIDLYVNVNNHYEGCAPLTIDRIREALPR
jgi:uncharacterized protein YecE (DUF72 family)